MRSSRQFHAQAALQFKTVKSDIDMVGAWDHPETMCEDGMDRTARFQSGPRKIIKSQRLI